jgi:uncharacterized protein YjiS (DUF1127 family)
MNSMTLARARGARDSNPIVLALRGFARRFVRDRALAKLRDLDDHLLRDIGLTRGDLETLRRH